MNKQNHNFRSMVNRKKSKIPQKSQNEKSKNEKTKKEEYINIIGNIIIGMGTGFGIGTGMEVGKQIGNSIFGSSISKENPPQKKINCEILFDFLQNCKTEPNLFHDKNCTKLFDNFEKLC